MSQELSISSVQVRSALGRYAQSCSATRDACLGGGIVNNVHELLTNLEKESNDITSYIKTLEEARDAINTAKSSVPGVARINNNKLPVEILARIFYAVPPVHSCLVQRNDKRQISGLKYPLYPDALAHVCSYWRLVAISCPGLWTHIDLALDHSLNPVLFARATAFAVRAGQLPLEIHISDPGSERERKRGLAIQREKKQTRNPVFNPSHNWADLHDFEFLGSDSVPIKSLELDLKIDHRYREVYYSILEYFFIRSKPGVLAQYLVRCADGETVDSVPFIEPVETPHSLDGALLPVSSSHLEDLWLPIQVVRVGGFCPYWTCKIYHGLVELYIDSGIPDITESQLLEVLKASPKLQVFHLKAAVAELFEDMDEFVSVDLKDLRDLKIMTPDDIKSGVIVLLSIDPGTVPLTFSFAGPPWGEISDFFARANVQRFYLTHREPCDLARVLRTPKSSRLEVLVLNGCDSDIDDDSCLLNQHYPHELGLQPTKIDTLYLLWFTRFGFEEVQSIVEMYSVQKLLIYGGQLSYQADEGRVVSDNTRNIRIKLSSITTCPIIEYYPDANQIHQDCDEWITDAVLC